jgi:hypothetical protein
MPHVFEPVTNTLPEGIGPRKPILDLRMRLDSRIASPFFPDRNESKIKRNERKKRIRPDIIEKLGSASGDGGKDGGRFHG